MSEFSDFFRKATPKQKARVYKSVLKAAAESQDRVIRQARTVKIHCNGTVHGRHYPVR